MKLFLCILVAAAIPVGLATAQDEATPEAPERAAADKVPTEDLSAIESLVESYTKAFNDGDVPALMKHWSPDGVYVDAPNAEMTRGAKAIETGFTQLFEEADPRPKLVCNIESLEWISPSVARERGIATVTRGKEVVESGYSVVYVKRDDTWLIDSVVEGESRSLSSRYQKLKPLEWLVGNWQDTGEGFSVELTCRWTANQNFLSRSYSVYSDGIPESSGLQIIGWDAEKEQIRSWLFDSSGGFVSGVWTAQDDRVIVHAVAKTHDGKKGSYTSFFEPAADGNSYQWKKIDRVLDGELLPNIGPITINRVEASLTTLDREEE